jgi:hypothetical protein
MKIIIGRKWMSNKLHLTVTDIFSADFEMIKLNKQIK